MLSDNEILESIKSCLFLNENKEITVKRETLEFLVNQIDQLKDDLNSLGYKY